MKHAVNDIASKRNGRSSGNEANSGTSEAGTSGEKNSHFSMPLASGQKIAPTKQFTTLNLSPVVMMRVSGQGAEDNEEEEEDDEEDFEELPEEQQQQMQQMTNIVNAAYSSTDRSRAFNPRGENAN